MTNYHLKPLTTLPSLASQEAREQRRKQLEKVAAKTKDYLPEVSTENAGAHQRGCGIIISTIYYEQTYHPN